MRLGWSTDRRALLHKRLSILRLEHIEVGEDWGIEGKTHYIEHSKLEGDVRYKGAEGEEEGRRVSRTWLCVGSMGL